MKSKKLSRIGEMLINRHLTHKQVADSLAVTPQAVGRWARGESKPSPAKLKELSQLLNTSTEELNNSRPAGVGGNLTAGDEITIPVVAVSPTVSAGDKDLVRMIKVSRNWILSRVPTANLQSLQLINPVDDSMAPTIPTTGFVIIDQAINSFDRDGVFFFERNGQRYIKRVQRLLDGSIQVISDNSKYPPQTVEPPALSEITVLGLCLVSCTATTL